MGSKMFQYNYVVRYASQVLYSVLTRVKLVCKH